MAVARRGGDVAGCILHSDRGQPGRARKVHRALTRHGMVGSMGQVGSCLTGGAVATPPSISSQRGSSPQCPADVVSRPGTVALLTGDNAAMESFFALLQKNVLDRRRRWETRDDLRVGVAVIHRGVVHVIPRVVPVVVYPMAAPFGVMAARARRRLVAWWVVVATTLSMLWSRPHYWQNSWRSSWVSALA